MKIALAQMNILWNDPEANIATCQRLLNEALRQSAEFIVFPEMFNTGFSFPVGEAAKKANQSGREFLETAARKHKIYLTASMPYLSEGESKPFNTLYLFGPNGLLGEYRKIYLISALKEGETYQGGRDTLTVPVHDFHTSFFICYDLRFPVLFSKLSEQTDLYVVVANWPSIRQAHWETLLAARAIENQAYVIGVNRVGTGGNLEFQGGSLIISPKGEIVAKGGHQEEIVIADLQKADVTMWRKQFPYLRDKQSYYKRAKHPDLQSGV